MMKETGNALFLILIAVALFAALSYAVTQSGRGGGNIDRETASLTASQIEQFSGQVISAVNRLRLVNGCSETEISFEKSPFDGSDAAYDNALSPNDFSCHIYHSNGGGVTELDIDNLSGLTNGASAVEAYASVMIMGAGTSPTGAMAPGNPAGEPFTDLTILVRDLTDEACTAVNNAVGLSPTPEDSGNVDVRPFVGDYTPYDTIDGCFHLTGGGCATRPDDSPFYINRTLSGCFVEASSGENIYFSVVLGR